MSWCKNSACICDYCGKFCVPYDEWTIFGDASGGWGEPEPYEPRHCCEKCWPKLKAEWVSTFSEGHRRSGDYGKSRAETEAAQEAGLVWLHSNGIGTYGTATDRQPYQYIAVAEYEQLKDLPRFPTK